MITKFAIPYEKAGQIALFIVMQSFHFLIMLLVLFFIFLNSARLSDALNHIIKAYTPGFSEYFIKARLVIRSVLDSMVYTGLGTGVILGVVYYFAHLPYPIFFAIFTALATAIPFALPFVLILIFLITLVQGQLISGLIILIIGTVLSFIIDHWIRPAIIEKYVNIHFLAAFLGALGGIEAFGLIGIYLGPVIMVLLTLFWQEALNNAKKQNKI
ncbi:AI-2E family transporter [Facilibium subflavum]|uniref:AI-2E family transporter n=1 Tax=Facilibium subflavum TaxID=2219058 RepID=UPI000E65584F|nr:AI-2E family transporter [Facilibium subflavum]